MKTNRVEDLRQQIIEASIVKGEFKQFLIPNFFMENLLRLIEEERRLAWHVGYSKGRRDKGGICKWCGKQLITDGGLHQECHRLRSKTRPNQLSTSKGDSDE